MSSGLRTRRVLLGRDRGEWGVFRERFCWVSPFRDRGGTELVEE